MTYIGDNPAINCLAKDRVAKYICIHEQNSDLRFFRTCENYYKENKEKLRADIMFVLGQYYKNKFSNYIDSKIISIGALFLK